MGDKWLFTILFLIVYHLQWKRECVLWYEGGGIDDVEIDS